MTADDGLFPAPAPPGAGAVLSDDGLYRYELTRAWGPGDRRAVFVMLNPSTADALVDDPTIRRCIGFAKREGCDGLIVVNLYAFRATQPKDLWTAADPIGPANDAHVHAAAERAAVHDWPLIVAWGANAEPSRAARVLAFPGMHRALAFRPTMSGAPAHPLYQSAHAPLTLYRRT